MHKKDHLKLSGLFLALTLLASCTGNSSTQTQPAPFTWENAHVYFLLTDRFMNGDPDNDLQFERTRESAVLRGFEGGDLQGVIQKMDADYFSKLGITAIWTTPWFEQIKGQTDEGTGPTYAYHGYWTADWTAIEPNLGGPEDIAELVEKAHAQGIRVIMDVIINHTGPITDKDPVWPTDWVRTEPACTYQDYPSTIECTLVENLPDIRTESLDDVDLPPVLLEKWEAEGRLEKEMAELDAFFKRTGYPRAPRYYIIKWLTDYIRKYGIDGYRLDTARHIEEEVWEELAKEAHLAFEEWKKANPDKVLDDTEFYMVGEVYGYNAQGGRAFDFGKVQVDYYDYGMHSLINFDFKESGRSGSYEELFSAYDRILHQELEGAWVLNFAASHDDNHPLDLERTRSMETAAKLLLCPGASQLYYGDESNRPLIVEGANGDANLRSFMNWDDIEADIEIGGVLLSELSRRYQLLGNFRKDHPSIGAGRHQMLSQQPYYFSRSYDKEGYSDQVIIGLDLPEGSKEINVKGIFPEGSVLRDACSGKQAKVKKGMVTLVTPGDILLLEVI